MSFINADYPVNLNQRNGYHTIIDKDDKKINFNWDDEIIKAVVLTNEGKLRLEQFN